MVHLFCASISDLLSTSVYLTYGDLFSASALACRQISPLYWYWPSSKDLGHGKFPSHLWLAKANA